MSNGAVNFYSVHVFERVVTDPCHFTIALSHYSLKVAAVEGSTPTPLQGCSAPTRKTSALVGFINTCLAGTLDCQLNAFL